MYVENTNAAHRITYYQTINQFRTFCYMLPFLIPSYNRYKNAFTYANYELIVYNSNYLQKKNKLESDINIPLWWMRRKHVNFSLYYNIDNICNNLLNL